MNALNIMDKIKNGQYKVISQGSSEVWLYFGKIVNVQTGAVLPNVICKHCDAILAFGKAFSCTNLKKHPCYKNRPETSNATLEVKKEESKKPCLMSVDDHIRENVVGSCAKFVVRDLVSYTTVNGEGFKDLAKCLIGVGAKLGVAKFSIEDFLPHSNVISKRLDHLHTTEVKLLAFTLQSIIGKGLTAGTIDMWTDCKQRDVLTLTIHYVNDWKLCNRIFFTAQVENFRENGGLQEKSAEIIMRLLDMKFQSLELPGLHKKITFVTDQTPNIEEALQYHSKVNCMTHTLTTILENTFNNTMLKTRAPNIFNLISKCERLAEHLHDSGLAKQLGSFPTHEDWTGWRTKYDICFSVHQHFSTIEEILIKSNKRNLLLEIDKYLLDKILSIFRLFKHAMLTLESKSIPTVHLALLTMHLLKDKLVSLQTEEFSDEVKSVISHCLENIFNATFVPHRVHKISAFLWPEFKQLRYLNDRERDEVYRLVKEELITYAEANISDNQIKISNSFDSYSSANNDSTGIDYLLQMTDQYTMYKDVHDTTDSNFETQIAVEMEVYKSCKFQDTNILRWWQIREKEFPLLSMLARQVLCIPASNAASKRCFHSTRVTFEERRASLDGENLDAILFLHSLYEYRDVL